MTFERFVALAWRMFVRLIDENRYLVAMAVYAVARATAATVESGYQGVLFSFGRAQRVVGPGLHWLIPFLQVVRVLPSRARTIQLPGQRVTTADGLVFDVDALLVYRVVAVDKALVEVDRLEKAMTQMLGLAVQEVLHGLGREALRVSGDLDDRLLAAMRPWVEPWGVAIDRAGVSTVRPSPRSVALLQLAGRATVRHAQLPVLARGTSDTGLALALLGGAPVIERRSVGAAFAEHAQGRVRRMRRQVDRYLRRFLAELDRWGGMLEVEALRQRVRDRRARQTPRAPVRSAPRRVDAARARWILHALPRYLEQSGRRWLEGRAAETLEQSRRWTHKHRGQAPDRARRLRERGGLSGLTASRDEQRREHARAAREARRERTSRRYSHAGRHRGQR